MNLQVYRASIRRGIAGGKALGCPGQIPRPLAKQTDESVCGKRGRSRYVCRPAPTNSPWVPKLFKPYRLERQIGVGQEAQIDSRSREAGSVRYNSHSQNSERDSALHPADREVRENRRRNAE